MKMPIIYETITDYRMCYDMACLLIVLLFNTQSTSNVMSRLARVTSHIYISNLHYYTLLHIMNQMLLVYFY